ncbi:TPA: hypothetical protein LLS51_004446 [Serratia marcescens]|nr:hypothetical protein [Serratia marcescens]HBK4675017.1 hypothetical protein [Serratia marcescens]
MKDYKNSVLLGIAAAKKAADNKEEIKSVIKELNSQIKEVSDKKATFGIISLYRKTDIPAIDAFFNIAQRMSTKKTDKYFAICIFDHEGKNGIEIAEWLQDDAGYPCTIQYNGQRFFCSNKAELEESFSKLLKEVKAGEAILDQISRYDNQVKPSHEEPI